MRKTLTALSVLLMVLAILLIWTQPSGKEKAGDL